VACSRRLPASPLARGTSSRLPAAAARRARPEGLPLAPRADRRGLAHRSVLRRAVHASPLRDLTRQAIQGHGRLKSTAAFVPRCEVGLRPRARSSRPGSRRRRVLARHRRVVADVVRILRGEAVRRGCPRGLSADATPSSGFLRLETIGPRVVGELGQEPPHRARPSLGLRAAHRRPLSSGWRKSRMKKRASPEAPARRGDDRPPGRPRARRVPVATVPEQARVPSDASRSASAARLTRARPGGVARGDARGCVADLAHPSGVKPALVSRRAARAAFRSLARVRSTSSRAGSLEFVQHAAATAARSSCPGGRQRRVQVATRSGARRRGGGPGGSPPLARRGAARAGFGVDRARSASTVAASRHDPLCFPRRARSPVTARRWVGCVPTGVTASNWGVDTPGCRPR
jgi:hypothetical protein